MPFSALRTSGLLLLGTILAFHGMLRSPDHRDDIMRLQGVPPARLHVSLDSLPWTTTKRYPDWFRRIYRYKELVGWVSNWQDVSAAQWKGIPNPDVRMGVLELDPGAKYPFHAHPAPELYYVLSGRAEWSVGNQTFVAQAGTAIETPPNTRHQMINAGPDTLKLLYVWWAPGGNRAVLDTASTMLTGWEAPTRPEH